jgi:hypothetical protein
MTLRSYPVAAVVALSAFALLLAIPAPSALADDVDYAVQVSKDGRLSVRAAGVSLGTLLHDVAAAAGIDKLSIDPAVESQRVTVTLTSVPVGEGVVQILGQAAVPFALWGTDDPRSMRLFAGGAEFLEKAQAQAAVSEPGRRSGADTVEQGVEEPVPDPEPDEAERHQQLDALNKALAPQPRIPGTPVALPFPGPDGEPLMSMPAVPGQPVALPFPGPDGQPLMVSPLTKPHQDPPSSDPALGALLEALAPRPQPKQEQK